MNSCRCLFGLLLLLSCTSKKSSGDHQPYHIRELPEPINRKKQISAGTSQFTLKDLYTVNNKLDKAVEQLFLRMTPYERASQLIMPAVGMYKGYGLPFHEALALCREKKIGGLLLLKGNIKGFNQQVQQINGLINKNGGTPLLFAIDGEPALIQRKLTDADSMMPAAMQHTDDQVNTSAQIVAEIAGETGAQLNFAPVVDRNTNTAIINRRSFGNNEDSIIHKASLFITQHLQKNKGCVIKHFPGHGAVNGDSHNSKVFIDGAMTELRVFEQLIRKNLPAGVMIGHIAVKNNHLWNTDGLPASISPGIMKKLLRDSLGFKGVIFTDAMNMRAATAFPGADYQSLVAGADIALMPLDATALHRKVLNALQRNDGLARQFERSVKRVIRLKFCLGIALD